jgi:hypothetical protein
MPRLGSLLVCEKVILDQQGKPTLVAVFQKISALIPEGQEVPKGILAMTAWSVFCEWFLTDAELTSKFEQVLEVLHPDGTPAPIRGVLPLKEVGKESMGTRTYVNMMGMPVAQQGLLTVNVWLESGSQRVTDIHSYRIEIEHTSKPPTPNEAGSIVHAVVPEKPPN